MYRCPAKLYPKTASSKTETWLSHWGSCFIFKWLTLIYSCSFHPFAFWHTCIWITPRHAPSYRLALPSSFLASLSVYILCVSNLTFRLFYGSCFALPIVSWLCLTRSATHPVLYNTIYERKRNYNLSFVKVWERSFSKKQMATNSQWLFLWLLMKLQMWRREKKHLY